MVCRSLLLLSLCLSFVSADESLIDEYLPSSSVFTGKALLSYKAEKSGGEEFFDPANNAFSATLILAMRRAFCSDWLLGLEGAGWSDLGLGIAESSRVSASITDREIGEEKKLSGAELSQAYLLRRQGGVQLRVGRQALSKRLSPWLWSDRSAGVLDIVYDGVTVAWSDDLSSLWYAGWIGRAVNQDDTTRMGQRGRRGVFLLTRVWEEGKARSFVSAFWVRRAMSLRPGEEEWRGYEGREWSLWGERWQEGEHFAYGAQLVYVDGEATASRPTLAAALRWQRRQGPQRWRITLAANNGGDYSMKSAGMGVGSGAFWGSSLNGEFGSDSVGNRMLLGRCDWRYVLGDGNAWYSSAAFADFAGEGDVGYRQAWGISLGRRFDMDGIFGKVEYRFRRMRYRQKPTESRQRLRVDLGIRF